MRELFIYYRVRRDRADAAKHAVQALQDSLRAAHPGLQARLLRRDADVPDALETWMETYAMLKRPGAADGPGVDAGLEAAIEAAAGSLAALLVGPRHVEGFDA